MKITVISDTHGKHKKIQLPGGDLLVHSGDFTSMGHEHEIRNFCKWFSKQDYTYKIFIAGNHELGLEDNKENSMNIINSFKDIIYLESDLYCIGNDYENMIKIFGTPWQSYFCNWAFNLEGEALQEKLDEILPNTDILVTHNPPLAILDTAGSPINKPLLGCPRLLAKVAEIKPSIHIFGHIHGGYGYRFIEGTHFINASILDEKYNVSTAPITFEWDKETNEVIFTNEI
ncbi:MAG: metallophosphoesterase [Candidatus Woesearchaeota archaeon]|jgi:Icc-related predicted phosphoesterase|nr:metallophosphoesterase [Candidatus Woesearchaeota archaeon]